MSAALKSKLAYFIVSLETGGSERSLVSLIAGLPRERFDVHIICLSGFGPLEEPARAAGATLHDLAYPRLRAGGRIQWRRIPRAIATLPRLVRLLRELRPDILHTMIPVCNVLGALAARRARVPGMHVCCTKASLGFYRKKHRLVAWAENRLASTFQLVHCKSRGILEEVAANEPISRDKMRVIYNGLDVSRYAEPSDLAAREEERRATRASLFIPANSTVVGMVANLWKYKGHSTVVEALGNLGERASNTYLVFIGRDEENTAAELRDLATRAGVGERMILAGERSDIPQLMRAMDILVSASHHEGFSNVVIEGMAAGLPIIATNVGGNPEAVEDGLSGILVEPRDAYSLAAALEKLLSDIDLRQQMGAAAQRRVRELFSYEAMLNGMLRFYDELTELTTPTPPLAPTSNSTTSSPAR